jgi:hypothetical protein
MDEQSTREELIRYVRNTSPAYQSILTHLAFVNDFFVVRPHTRRLLRTTLTFFFFFVRSNSNILDRQDALRGIYADLIT